MTCWRDVNKEKCILVFSGGLLARHQQRHRKVTFLYNWQYPPPLLASRQKVLPYDRAKKKTQLLIHLQ